MARRSALLLRARYSSAYAIWWWDVPVLLAAFFRASCARGIFAGQAARGMPFCLLLPSILYLVLGGRTDGRDGRACAPAAFFLPHYSSDVHAFSYTARSFLRWKVVV